MSAPDRGDGRTLTAGGASRYPAGPFHGGVMNRSIVGALGPSQGKLLRYEQANDPSGTVSYASVGLWEA